MARPVDGYRLKDGTRVPGVTTICNVAKESGGLINWAWKLGMQGIDYNKVRDDAGSAGTLAHEAVEHWIRGKPYVMQGEPEIVKRGQQAFDNFLTWANQTQLQVTHPEVTLVSETYRVGGTLDAILISHQRAIGDWKSADAVYPEALMQIAAYGHLWMEAHPEDDRIAGYHLIRFDKTNADYHHHFWSELDDAWAAFLLCRQLYDLKLKVKARCR